MITQGNVNDNVPAVDIFSDIEIAGSCVTGDKAYGTKAIREHLEKNSLGYIIPPKSNTKQPWAFDEEKYKARNLVERFINKLKHFRHVATRYDKLQSRFSSFVYLACVMILLK